VQGAVSVKKCCPDAFCIFVLPPSEEELLARLRARGREDEAKIQRRFGEARREIEVARNCGVYDVFLVNRTLEAAIAQAIGLVNAEWDRRRRVAG
jgi:guanylate kinase